MPAYPTYEVEVSHEGLHKYRLIKGTDPHVVKQKAVARGADEIARPALHARG